MSLDKSRFITDYLEENALKQPDKPAIVFEGRKITWNELWREVGENSGFFLENLGTKEQRVVAILLTNSPDFVSTYLAVLHAGHIALPLDPAYKKLELSAIIEDIGPDLVITESRYRSLVSEAGTKVADYSDLSGSKKTWKPLRTAPEKQIASLTFTSGTTGTPKAATYTHANHIWNIQVCSKVWEWTDNDTILLSLPLSHWYGIVMGLSGAIFHANTIFLLDQRYDAPKTLKLLSSGKITFFTHTSVVYMKLLADTEGAQDLSSVRLMVSGGSPLPPAVWKGFKQKFGVELVETYGSSETGRIAANSLAHKILGSPGKVLPGVEVKFDKNGELMVKSPGLFPGYYKNTKGTKKNTAPGGWWRTGDTGYIKNDYVYLKGRLKERIRRYGYTVSPRDVEWSLLKNPEVKEIFVMGRQKPQVPNDELIYFIRTKLSDTELLAFCKENLIFAWRPDRIIRIDRLPRSRLGKPQIAKLEQMAGENI